MTALADACADLAALLPRLAAALARDSAAPGGTRVLSAGGVVNTDVLHAMLTLSHEIPAARAAACDLAGEPWQPRPPLTCLRAIPRLRDRLTDLRMPGAAGHLENCVIRWTRMTKLALGLRTPDIPVGYDCPYHRDEDPGPAELVLLGAEGFIRGDMTMFWVYDGRIRCPACGASWLADRWPMLGRMLISA